MHHDSVIDEGVIDFSDLGLVGDVVVLEDEGVSDSGFRDSADLLGDGNFVFFEFHMDKAAVLRNDIDVSGGLRTVDLMDVGLGGDAELRFFDAVDGAEVIKNFFFCLRQG